MADHGADNEAGAERETALGRRRITIIVLSLLITAALVLLLRSPLFGLESVHVRGVDRLSPGEVAAVVPVEWGDLIWSIDRAMVAQAVQAIPRVDDVQVSLLLPNRLEITVTELRPVAMVSADGLWEVSAGGRVLGEVEPDAHQDLPIITGTEDDAPPPGALWHEPGLTMALVFLAADGVPGDLSELYLGSRPDHLTAYMSQGTEVRLPARLVPAEEAEEHWHTLAAILQALEEEQVQAEYVDLRFEGRPVVRPQSGEVP